MLLQTVGNPTRVSRELRSFRKAAQVLSSDHPRLIDQYPKEWVAIYRGEVVAHGRTLDAVLKAVKRKGIPQERTIIHYIETNQRTMILNVQWPLREYKWSAVS